MTNMRHESSSSFWTAVSDELDIPRSLYEKAATRHLSVGEWLCRPESSLAVFQPNVRPQGSFRYGTVTKPVVEGTAYDLDQVVVLELLRHDQLSQADLKTLFGGEIAAYARAHGMQPPEEKHRCLRLNYRDEVSFHLDSLPGVPAGRDAVAWLRGAGVAESWASRLIAITDDRHPQYALIGGVWITSNPRGFARWFESRAALGRAAQEGRGAQASIEDVPAYEWRTPLQRSIQILKRHRDVMFRYKAHLAPISMIIANLAARAYNGERDVGTALNGIVERMGQHVNQAWPRVPNPTHPLEDYADKWRVEPALEMNFWTWLEQVRADVHALSDAYDSRSLGLRFQVALPADADRRLVSRTSAAITAAPLVREAPRPWGDRSSGF